VLAAEAKSPNGLAAQFTPEKHLWQAHPASEFASPAEGSERVQHRSSLS
jgi:hypothetical protein